MMHLNTAHANSLHESQPAGGTQTVAATVRDGIQHVLTQNYAREALIDAVSAHPRFAFLYSQDSRVYEQYTIREHTEMVLGQFDRYLERADLMPGISKEEFRLMLALHDIGKPIPEDKNDQHEATLEVIEAHLDLLPFTPRGWEIAKEMIHQDIFGDCIRSFITEKPSLERRGEYGVMARGTDFKFSDLTGFTEMVKFPEKIGPADLSGSQLQCLDAAADTCKVIADRLKVPVQDLFPTLLTFYQADTSAYTYDAAAVSGRRGTPGLDFLYTLQDWSVNGGSALVRKNGAPHLLFSPPVESIIALLRARL